MIISFAKGSKDWLKYLRRSIAVLLVGIIWEILPQTGIIDPFVLPRFSVVIKSLIQLVVTGELTEHFLISFQRAFIGFTVSMAVAIPFGILIGWYKKIERIVDPVVQAGRNTSVIAMYPVFMIFLGLTEMSKVVAIFWGAMWPTLINMIEGVKQTDTLLIKAARSMGISTLGLFYKVVLPASLPYLMSGIRLSAGYCILLLVVTEMISANAGLGYMVFALGDQFRIPEMYASVLILAFLGLLINIFLNQLEKRLIVGDYKNNLDF